MDWIRYLLYFLLIALITWSLTALEIHYPGSLRLQVFIDNGDTLGTSEFSPLEMIQPLILIVCGLLMGWVAHGIPSQRPLAFPFGAMALMATIRELDYFLDRYIADNLWQLLVGIAGALIIVYTYRHRRRLVVALARVWPSPGLTLLFSGAVILFGFVHLVGHEPLWQAILGDDYSRLAKLAFEEFVELIGYLLWLVGTLEYTYQVHSIAEREPVTAAVRRRRRRAGGGQRY